MKHYSRRQLPKVTRKCNTIDCFLKRERDIAIKEVAALKDKLSSSSNVRHQ